MQYQQRLARAKMTILGIALTILGIGLIAAGDWLVSLDVRTVGWLHLIPLTELGSTLAGIGVVGMAYDYYTKKDEEANGLRRLKQTFEEQAPLMRDTVIRGFAVQPEDLRRVATPELLDQLASNVLGLRLGDPQFGSELYTDLRDQAIRAPERWYDVEVNVRLSTSLESDLLEVPLFDALVEWEYTTVPSHPVRRFASVSSREDYTDLVTDVPTTATWFVSPRSGLDAGRREAFELLYFGVDGQERPIRRSARKAAQTYIVTIGEDIVRDAQPVRIKQIYRARVRQAGHFLFIEIPQPSRDLSLKLDYTDAAVDSLSVMDLVTSSRRTQVGHMPEQVDARVVSVDLPGWVLPRAGFTFVWTLSSEVPAATAASGSSDPGVRR